MARKKSDIPVKPWCPFCGEIVGKPADKEHRKLGEFPVGNCQCGAVYAFDATGWNVGAAMIEAMVYACDDNWDLAWDLTPDDDYLTDRVEPYDEITNQVVETGNLDGRKVKGVLYFVRLQGDVTLINKKTNNKKSIPKRVVYIPDVEPERDPKRQKMKARKADIPSMVVESDIDGLVDLVFDDIKTLRFMQRLLYSVDDSIRWKTIDAMGKVCARFATRKPGKVSDLLHSLFAACSDSASSGWGNIETIGSIIGARPDIFGAFSHHLLNFLEDTSTQVATIWALSSIARHRPDLIRKMPFFQLIKLLDYSDPAIRGNTLRLFSRIKASEARSKIESLLNDSTLVTIYEDGVPVEKPISQLAKEAINSINELDQGDK